MTVNIKQFPSGNYDIDGVFISKKGDIKSSAKRQLKLLISRYNYDKSEENLRVINKLKNIIKELK